MKFYCPNCQQVIETNPASTVITKFQQTAYKAQCSICGKDMAVYGKQEEMVSQETHVNA